MLLKRNAPVREALLGRKAARTEATSPTTKPAREVIAWDDEGMRLINRGRPEDARKACKLFRRAAEKGYAESQYRLGYCYESGGGIPADPAVANQWYLKAANQGHVHAQYKLAHGYRVGRGVAVDLAVALDWYRKAAAQGDLDALHNVAWMHATGQGVPASAESAFEWFRKAAEQGAVGSQFEVAKRLLDGDGTPRNVTESFVWLLILRAQRNTIAPEDRQQVEALLQAIKPDLTPEAESAAQARALELMKDLSRRFLEGLGNS